MTHTLESLRFNYYENTLDAEDFMHIIINLQDELADLRADRDSESRWAAQYLSERDKARAEVDRLRAEIARQESAPRWIPVSERMPEEGKWVWTTDKNGKCATCKVKRIEGVFGFTILGFPINDITHWMPLPDAPKEQP